MKIRPFKEYVQRGRDLPTFEISGRFEDERFIVSTLGAEITLEIVTRGVDKRGTFAIVKAHEQRLPNGFRIRVEIDPNDDLPPGTVIRVFLDGISMDVAEELARIRGVDPVNSNLATRYERSFSVHFSNSGIPNGISSSYIDSGRKPSVN